MPEGSELRVARMDKIIADADGTRGNADRAPHEVVGGALALGGEVRDSLVRMAYRFLWDRHEAEDAVQDALAVAHQRGAELRDQARWRSWVCKIVVHRCHLAMRARGRRRKHQVAYAREAARRCCGTDSVGSRELAVLVRRLLPELPRRAQEVVVLHHLQGMGYEEIAEALGISPATARVHARTGREALRELLLARHPEALGSMSRSKGAEP